MQRDGHARAPHAEQQREELVGDDETVLADSVLPHQNPAREAFAQAAASVGQRVWLPWLINTWT